MNRIKSTDFVYLLLLMVVNMHKRKAKVVIRILQGNVVTQTMLGGLTIILQLQISSSVYVPKIMKIGWQ